tara:strand:- start:3052 stop:3399 length:348 start_codon:yes stop_codon:yes gene_type:complete
MSDNLPEPKGWRILIRKEKVKDKTEGGLYLPDQAKQAEELLSITAQVVKIGPMCWYDKEKGTPWIGGAWAKPGDWVIVPKFTRFKMEIDGEEYRLINDDEIFCVIDDPSSIKVYA